MKCPVCGIGNFEKKMQKIEVPVYDPSTGKTVYVEREVEVAVCDNCGFVG